MIPIVLALLLVAFALSVTGTAAMVRVGRRLGTLDSAGAEGHAKTELRSVPNVGGVAVTAAIVLPLAIGLAAAWILSPERWIELLPALASDGPDPAYLPQRVRESTPDAVALLGCVLLLHVTGLVDDRRALPWLPKLLVQLAAAGVMTVFFDVRLLTLLGPVPSVLVTVAWIAVVTNAMNFIDNMDGLCGGTGMVAALLFMSAALVNAQWWIAATLALLAGALAGFLVFNAPPARIFLGDGGSLVVGFLLGVLTARTTFVHEDLGGGWYAVFMPLVVLAVPLYDFLTVTAIRLRQGRSPFVGDQQHFSHRLVQRGLTRRGAVAVIVGLTAVTGVSGVFLGSLEPWQAVLVGVQTILVLGVVGLLEHASRHAARPGDGP